MSKFCCGCLRHMFDFCRAEQIGEEADGDVDRAIQWDCFIVSSSRLLSGLVWLPSDCRQDKRNARNTHSECQSVFNEQRVLAAPSAPAPASALACCCHILRKSQNQLARNQIELRAGAGAGRGLVATAAATSQHRQCCGKAEAER